MEEKKCEAIIVLVNSGYSEDVMDAAREAGARGGTIINARGTGTKDMEKRYNIVITPDKEMIIILTAVEQRDQILSAIYKAVGLGTDGQGIAFSIPVENVVGIKF